MVEEDKNKKHNKKEIKEDTMEKEKTVIFIKEKFMIFIIGFLIGAIVATSGCIIYNKITAKNNTTTAIQNNWNNNQPPGMNDHRNKRNNPNMNEETQGENLPEIEGQNQNDKQRKKEKNNNQQNHMSESDNQNKNSN